MISYSFDWSNRASQQVSTDHTGAEGRGRAGNILWYEENVLQEYLIDQLEVSQHSSTGQSNTMKESFFGRI